MGRILSGLPDSNSKVEKTKEDLGIANGKGENTKEEKPDEVFRNYVDSVYQERVSETYRKSHTFQTVAYAHRMREEICSLKKAKMSVWEAIEFLEEIIDESDPDTNLPQIVHLLQTAEAIRKEWPGPEYDWFHLTGFLHDLGKVLAHPKLYNLPQWSTVGDTFPVGCKFSKKNIFPEHFKDNEDSSNPLYNTKYGMYTPNCGLSNVLMSFGHDEYFYQVCVQNKCTLPVAGLYVIRFHSFYPWHNKGAYTHLCDEQDNEMLKWVKEFQKFDLYSKDDSNCMNLKELTAYYKGLINKYFPEVLNW